MGESNAELARTLLGAFNARDRDRLLDHVTEDVLWHPFVSVWERQFEGHDGVARWLTELSEVWDELQVELTEVTDLDGHRVICCGELRGRAPGAAELTVLPTAWAVWMRARRVRRLDFFTSREAAMAVLEAEPHVP